MINGFEGLLAMSVKVPLSLCFVGSVAMGVGLAILAQVVIIFGFIAFVNYDGYWGRGPRSD